MPNASEAQVPLTVRTRIISYNTHLFLDILGNLYGPLLHQDKERLREIILRIGASLPDVVGLSEVWADSTKDAIIDAVKPSLPYSYYGHTSEVQLGSGLLLLSRHPLSGCTYTPYRDLVGVDALTGKGYYTARATVPTPAGPASVFLLLSHTQADATPEAVQARARNIQQLTAAVARLPGDGTVVLMGDLNISAEENGMETDEYAALRTAMQQHGLQDVCRMLYPSAATHPMYTYDPTRNKLAQHFAPQDRVPQRLDYVFARGLGVDPAATTEFSTLTDWTYRDSQLGDTDLSDHYPLLTIANATAG